MKKITKKMQKELETSVPNWTRNWDSGAVFSISLDWNTEQQVVSVREVRKDLQAYLNKWPGRRKFVATRPTLSINYVR
jgi:hypothetical protein